MSDRVLIIGAGPTGLTAALELARLGVPVRIVEKRPEPPTTSRAIGVQARTLELLDRRGLASELVRVGNRVLGGTPHGGGKPLLHLDFTRIDSPFPFILMVSQAETERVLREAIGKLGVVIERGVELVGIAQDAHSADPNPVKAVLRHPDGRMERAEAPWLISAEGAHSSVRATLDLPFEGRTFESNYALGDLYADGDLPEADMQIFTSDRGFLAVFPLGGRHFRLIVAQPDGDPKRGTPPTIEELQAVYDDRAEVPARFRDLAWSSWFWINSRMVARLRVGRFLLGGDSAHIHSPAGAQGMNTGIQDMINLGWKLAWVIRGHAPESLLDTYEQDRLPVMRNVLSNTERLTGMIGSEDPVVRGLFNHLGPWIGGTGLVQNEGPTRMSQIAVGYRQSPLSANHAHGGTLHAGDRLPDLPMRALRGEVWSDARLFELLDPSRFVLLIVHPEGSDLGSSELREAAREWPDLIGVEELSAPADDEANARFRSAFGRPGGAFLARPDGYLGLASGLRSGAGDLREYGRRWLKA